jgi:hypothetical protein
MKFSIDWSAVPKGLTIDPENGIVSGTPHGRAGEYGVPIEVHTATGTVKGKRFIVLQTP